MLLWSLLVIFGPLSEEADWLTLDAPSVVFEGDSIDLMCQKKKDWWEIQTVVYYRDGKQLVSRQVSSVSIPRAAPSDSGQYSCSATAGKYFLRKSKSSRSVRIEVLGTGGCRRDHVTARVLGTLCGGLGFIAAALLCYYWSHKIAGGRSAPHAPRDASSANPQESTHASSLPNIEELQLDYVNANTRRMILENKDSHVIYSDVKET
uniref:Ig-like domain-containing protein n=1 Tax=Neovison vison TaxID=452646 RepID=A0A8C7BVJ4_NEOVI